MLISGAIRFFALRYSSRLHQVWWSFVLLAASHVLSRRSVRPKINQCYALATLLLCLSQCDTVNIPRTPHGLSIVDSSLFFWCLHIYSIWITVCLHLGSVSRAPLYLFYFTYFFLPVLIVVLSYVSSKLRSLWMFFTSFSDPALAFTLSRSGCVRVFFFGPSSPSCSGAHFASAVMLAHMMPVMTTFYSLICTFLASCSVCLQICLKVGGRVFLIVINFLGSIVASVASFSSLLILIALCTSLRRRCLCYAPGFPHLRIYSCAPTLPTPSLFRRHELTTAVPHRHPFSLPIGPLLFKFYLRMLLSSWALLLAVSFCTLAAYPTLASAASIGFRRR